MARGNVNPARITNYAVAHDRYQHSLSYRQRKLVDAYMDTRLPTPEGTPPHDQERNFIEAVEIAILTAERDIPREIALLNSRPKLHDPARSYGEFYGGEKSSQ